MAGRRADESGTMREAPVRRLGGVTSEAGAEAGRIETRLGRSTVRRCRRAQQDWVGPRRRHGPAAPAEQPRETGIT